MKRKDQDPIKPPWDEWDGEYIGNMWGWKFSLFALALILALLAIVFYRYYVLGIPFDINAGAEPMILNDSIPSKK